jgi:hypothetical protein
MRPKRIARGTVFMREGEVKQNDHMLLVLEGRCCGGKPTV